MKTKGLFLALAAVLALAACKSDKKEAEPQITIHTFDELPDIDEVHGTIGSGTSMNVLELLTDSGDTLRVDMNSQAVTGGEAVGDEVQLVYCQTDSSCTALIATNLTSLQHLWSQPGADGHTQSLELNSGGRAATYGMAIDYDSWRVADGMLLLHSPKKLGDETPAVVDTFEIMELTDTRLVLSNGVLTTEFDRDN